MSDIHALEDRLAALIQDFNEYRNTNPLERSSVKNGRLRFAGGLLLIDNGGTLQVVGTLDGDGDFHWSGPWSFESADGGSIDGDVDLRGNFDLTGKFTSQNVRIEGGKIYVGAGASQIIIDGADGSITAGNVKIQDGKIYVGVGASQIVIDGATGKIMAANMAIDPADGGKITFPGGAALRADVGNGVQMQIGNVKISAQAAFVMLTVGTRSIVINSMGISAGLPTAPLANWPGRQVGDVVSNTSGDLFRIV